MKNIYNACKIAGATLCMLGKLRDNRQKSLNHINALSMLGVFTRGCTSVADGLASANMLKEILKNPTNEQEQNLDVICLIYLLYQNLGTVVEAIPYEFRDRFAKEIAPLYDSTQDGKQRSRTIRSASSHIKSFGELYAAHISMPAGLKKLQLLNYLSD